MRTICITSSTRSFPKLIDTHRLIRQEKFVKNHIQVPHEGMDIHGFHRISANKVDTVEILRQFQQIGTVRACSRYLFTNLQITIIGRRRHIAKYHMAATNRNGAVSIARSDSEMRGGFADDLHDPVTAHPRIGSRCGTPLLLEQRKRFGVQKFNADVFAYLIRVARSQHNNSVYTTRYVAFVMGDQPAQQSTQAALRWFPTRTPPAAQVRGATQDRSTHPHTSYPQCARQSGHGCCRPP